MRKELFKTNDENITEFMTKRIGMLRSARDNMPAEDGINYHNEFSGSEVKELRDYVITLADEEMKKTVGSHFIRQHDLNSYQAESFLSILSELIITEIYNYNDPRHLSDSEKLYVFGTFLKHLCERASIILYSEEKGHNAAFEKEYIRIRNIKRDIASEKRIDVNEVTLEMIHERLPRFSVQKIDEVLKSTVSKASIEDMHENNKGLNDPSLIVSMESDIFNELDVDTERMLDLAFDNLSDLDKFFVLLEVGALGEDLLEKTSLELSMDKLLLNIVKADERVKDFIETETVYVYRPGRSTSLVSTCEEYQNVDHLSLNIIRSRKSKASKVLGNLRHYLKFEDIGCCCGVKYFDNQAKLLIEKYN